MYDIEKIRSDFPILARQIHGKPLVYLDNGASAQKPKAVIDAVSNVYSNEYANVHRGLHYLSNATTDAYEKSRETVRRFLNAPSVDEIVFTSGTTDAINLVAYGWAMKHLKAGDEIILTDFNKELFGLNTERHYTIDNKPFKGTLLGIEKDGLGVFSRKGRDNIKVQSSNVVWSFIGEV